MKVEAWNDDPEPFESLTPTWIQVTGLQTKWCEWTALDQAISVCGIMIDVDWMSIFRHNDKCVRLYVNCRDPLKIPSGRIFHYHGHLFQLGFTAEPPSAEEDDLLGEELNDQDKGNGANGNGHGQIMDTDGKGSGFSKHGSAPSNGGNNGPSSHSTKTRMVGDLSQEVVDELGGASAVFQLLVKKGVIDNEGLFVWDKTPMSSKAQAEVE